MLAKEHPEAIEGEQLFIDVDILESEKAAKDDSINYDGAASDEEDGSGLIGEGVKK